MLQVLKRKPLIKRIPTFLDRTDGIQRYDVDNLYPQRAEEALFRSFTVKAAVQKLGEFILGEGFEDEALNTLIINEKEQTGFDILTHVALACSKYDAFALHFQYNLNGSIAAINPIKFKYGRFGLPNEEDKVTHIMYSTNWEQDPYKERNMRRTILAYPVFNPNPEVVKSEIAEYGGINEYPGQILYYTPEHQEYPKSTFDAVLDQAQTQAEIGLYELSNIQEGFVGTTIFKYPGRFKDKEEEIRVQQKLNLHKGADGSRIIVAENPDPQNSSALFETVSSPSEDKLFEFTSRNVKNAIMENFGMPKEILGVLPESGMFNQENMENAYTYFNSVTRSKRNNISRQLSKIFEFWNKPVMTEAKIKPLQYTNNDKDAAPTNQPE